jgi:hypothetical protein
MFILLVDIEGFLLNKDTGRSAQQKKGKAATAAGVMENGGCAGNAHLHNNRYKTCTVKEECLSDSRKAEEKPIVYRF